MPRPKGTAFNTRNDYNHSIRTVNKSPELEYDAQTITHEIATFDHRLGTASGKTAFKYPGIELNRNFEPKLFRQSNAEMKRMMLSTQRTTNP